MTLEDAKMALRFGWEVFYNNIVFTCIAAIVLYKKDNVLRYSVDLFDCRGNSVLRAKLEEVEIVPIEG